MKKKIIIMAAFMLLGFAVVPVSIEASTKKTTTVYEDPNETDYFKFDVATGVYNLKVNQGGNIAVAANSAVDDSVTRTATTGKAYTIRIPQGTYIISGTIRLESNMTLDASGCVIQPDPSKTEKYNYLAIGTTSERKVAVGYSGFSNVAIVGGAWYGGDSNTSPLITMCHASNVLIQNVELVGGNCSHQAEICAIDGLTVTGCTFRDMFKTSITSSGESKNYEALQLDVPTTSSIFPNCYSDGTVMKNVVISNNNFINIPRGMGTHSMLIGAYNDNIQIINNSFTNVEKEAIIAVAYTNTLISGNTITNCGGGVLVQSFKYPQDGKNSSVYNTTDEVDYVGTVLHDLNVQVTNNAINVRSDSSATEPVGIKIFGYNVSKKITGTGDAIDHDLSPYNYYITGVNVSGNVITGYGHGIHLQDAYACNVSSNIVDICGINCDAIVADTACSDLIVSANAVASSYRCGIAFRSSSTAANLSANTVTGAGTYGILVNSSSKVTTPITANAISGTKLAGILLSTSATVDSITNNVISGSLAEGIKLSATSKSNSPKAGVISGNTISACVSYGIYVGATEDAYIISKNKIENCTNYAGYVAKDGKAEFGNNTLVGNEHNQYFILGTKSEDKDAKKYSAQKKVSSIKLKKDKGQITVSWSKVNKCTGYQIWYSTDKKFQTYNIATVKGAKKVSKTIKNLDSKKKYYVRVRAYKSGNGSKVFGQFSKVKNIKTK